VWTHLFGSCVVCPPYHLPIAVAATVPTHFHTEVPTLAHRGAVSCRSSSARCHHPSAVLRPSLSLLLAHLPTCCCSLARYSSHGHYQRCQWELPLTRPMQKLSCALSCSCPCGCQQANCQIHNRQTKPGQPGNSCNAVCVLLHTPTFLYACSVGLDDEKAFGLETLALSRGACLCRR
jgi:hypothetical protein